MFAGRRPAEIEAFSSLSFFPSFLLALRDLLSIIYLLQPRRRALPHHRSAVLTRV
jgi:hypothetical protein